MSYHDKKHDLGKRRFTLLPWESILAVIDVLEYGAQKYSEDSWRTVPDAKKRYTDALFRHLVAWHQGERIDPESGLRHLSHVACNALFLVALDRPEA